jgi:diguanylate cyclase (GGDEF)-like protein
MKTAGPEGKTQSPSRQQEKSREQCVTQTELAVDEHLVADKVHSELARMFNERMIASAFAAPLGIGFLAWLQAEAAGPQQALLWTMVMIALELLIIGFGAAFRKTSLEGRNPHIWLQAQLACCGAVGLAWGAATWVVWSPDKFLYYIIALCVLVGVSFSSLVVMTPMRFGMRAFLMGIGALPLLQLLTIDTPINRELGAGWLIMIGIQLWYAVDLRHELVQQIDSSVRNGLLVQRLQQVGLELTRANTDLNLAMGQLNQLLTFDQLTGAYSRRHFMDELERQVAHATRHGAALSLIMLDLDHFKQINDQHGHAVGDRVLREAAVQVQGQLRDGDLLGRVGGEEFLVLLPMTGGAQAARLAERLRAALEAVRLGEGDLTIQLTGSFGVAALTVNEEAGAWLRRVDQALYLAKTLGRNRVVAAG